MGMKPRTLALVGLCATVSIAYSGPDLAKELTPTRIYQIIRPFTDDEGNVATNISGLACMPAAPSRCLVIDDQGRFAQIASLRNGRMAAGARLPLIGIKPSKDTVGQPPAETGCSDGERKFRDLDGEAVAYAAPFFYVIGSHGCSRHSNKFRSSSFILARVPDAWVANPSPAASSDPSNVETSYRLSEALTVAAPVRPYFAQDLMSANGVNVEGLAVVGGKLFAGLRAPTLNGMGFVVVIDANRLFDEGASIDQGDVRVISAPLGAGRGIRDLARLNDRQLLILSGPAQDAPAPFEIHVLDIKAETTTLLGTLGELPDAAGAKAEAISVLSQRGNIVDILVMFDGLPSGGPREYKIIVK
jgi:hypothetical protein